MTTQAIIYALTHSIKGAHKVQMERGPAAAEEMLRRTQFLWLKERPLPLHTLN